MSRSRIAAPTACTHCGRALGPVDGRHGSIKDDLQCATGAEDWRWWRTKAPGGYIDHWSSLVLGWSVEKASLKVTWESAYPDRFAITRWELGQPSLVGVVASLDELLIALVEG